MTVQQFLKLLEETVQKYKLTAEKIYNVDETGITVNSKGVSKIIVSKEKRQVGALASDERGKLLLCLRSVYAFDANISPEANSTGVFEWPRTWWMG